MVVTEDEAKKLWCPMLNERHPQGEDHVYIPRCVASKCMWWVWVNENHKEKGWCKK